MKSPDEIKKGLECCADVGRCLFECPYCVGNNTLACINKMGNDALAYIRQLEQAAHTPPLKPLTLSEIRSVAPDRPLYLETKCVDGLGHLWGADAADMIQGYYGKNEYGHIFRYWPDRKPTEEERKATPWME